MVITNLLFSLFFQPGNVASVQPIVYNDLSVVCNGELYNHEELKSRCPLDGIRNGASDCAAIIHSFIFFKGDLRKTCASLDGVFAFLMADKHNLYIGRDPIGVRPLFYGHTASGFFFCNSFTYVAIFMQNFLILEKKKENLAFSSLLLDRR